ncbi:MAG: hypothetical protein DMG49_27020 [Acidobacteria bacterium]|nr:MAG: hypothetical protein DMG49_27020 [Acidobacteriota bacterium]
MQNRSLNAQHSCAEPGMTQYVSSMLVDFADIGNLYRLQNAQGKRLEDVGEMLTPLLIGPEVGIAPVDIPLIAD